MGSGLSVVANIVQILGFAVQLAQAGPDLVGLVPGFVRKYAGLRVKMRKSKNSKKLNLELIPCDAGARDVASALEEGRVGGEQAPMQSSIHRHRTW